MNGPIDLDGYKDGDGWMDEMKWMTGRCDISSHTPYIQTQFYYFS